MAQHDSKTKGANPYAEMAEGVDMLRETLRVMVAAVMNEGFTEEQARDIVTGLLGRINREENNDG